MQEENSPLVISINNEITIPHVFVYNIEFRGRQYIDVLEEKSSMQAKQHTTSGVARVAHDFSISARRLTFTSRNLPAIRQDESSVGVRRIIKYRSASICKALIIRVKTISLTARTGKMWTSN